MSWHGSDEHQNKNLSKSQTFGNAEAILLTSFSPLCRNVDLRHCDSVCNLGPDEEIQKHHKESSSPHMSNFIKTEVHVQGSPSESQAPRDLQISKDQWGYSKYTFCSSECLLSQVKLRSGVFQSRVQKAKSPGSQDACTSCSIFMEAWGNNGGNLETDRLGWI